MKMLTKKSFKQQQGFTLIELVIVIVILGILAATAAPKFIDLTSDAKVAVMKGVEGSIESAVSMVHAKAILSGAAGPIDTIEIDGVFYAVANGYPRAQNLGAGTGADADNALGITGLVELDDNDFTLSDVDAVPADADGNGAVAAGRAIQHQKNAPAAGGDANASCSLVYFDSTAPNTRPVINNEELDNC